MAAIVILTGTWLLAGTPLELVVAVIVWRFILIQGRRSVGAAVYQSRIPLQHTF